MADERGEVRGGELDAEAQARRRLALAQIRQYPDPALRLPAREVADYDEELLRLVERMKGLMADANGVGLAATQVGILRRVFVFQPEEDVTMAVVNPTVTPDGAERAVDEEGCLSIQGVLVPVERSVRVRLEGRDEHGGEVRVELEGLAARVAQHELDHLDGVLMLDRTSPDAKKEALAILRGAVAT
jgi:peptide deformylase